jgi:glucose/arabinose dehydrogenase
VATSSLKSRENLSQSRRVAGVPGILLATVALLACDGSEPVTPPVEDPTVSLELVVDGLEQPLYLTSPPGDSQRLFVVERGGTIDIVRGGAVVATPFLDISDKVATAGEEQGLLGLAFHPLYGTNGFFYVSYTRASDNSVRIERYTVSANADVANEASAFPILTVSHPNQNHNGGMLAFGPDDKLYIGLGDGGTGSSETAQNFGSLLGSILRIDVDGGSPYAVPSDNPFVGVAGRRPELWAKGLRNPWRFSFDRDNGDLVIADVGEATLEEIDFQPASSAGGENYGWDTMEGSACFDPPSGCTTTGLVLPIHEYGRSEGCSITGGYVYRGTAHPDLAGRYFFSDFCASLLKSVSLSGGAATDEVEHDDATGLAGVSSFGEDAAGELYVLSMFAGTVHRIVLQ